MIFFGIEIMGRSFTQKVWRWYTIRFHVLSKEYAVVAKKGSYGPKKQQKLQKN